MALGSIMKNELDLHHLVKHGVYTGAIVKAAHQQRSSCFCLHRMHSGTVLGGGNVHFGSAQYTITEDS